MDLSHQYWFALPASLAMGLLQATERYVTLPRGYCGRQQRVARPTYHKHPGADWPEEAFGVHADTPPTGEAVALRLADPAAPA